MKLAVLIIVVALFMGCVASNAQIKKAMDPWIGNRIDALVMKWGAPSGTRELQGGIVVYTWVYNGGSYATVTQLPYTNALIANQYSSYCRFDWFADSEGVIINYRHEGECVIK